MDVITIEKGPTVRLLLKDFIQLSGVTGITSDAIFFAPNIPKDKLSNALAAYGSAVSEADVVILIDDTFWGSAKEGILITTDALLFKEKGNKPRRAKFEILRQLASHENQIILNGKNVGVLNKAGKLELGYVFSVLNKYVTFSARDVSAREENTHVVDKQALMQLCARFITPQYVPEKQPSPFTKPTTTPGYHVGEAMSDDLSRMARFSLGLPELEEIIAARDLTRHGSGLGCFVITTAGVYAKREQEFEITFLPWSKLKGLTVVSEHKENHLRGVVLSNGQVLVTSWENAVVLPFGVKLVSDLIRLAAGGTTSLEASDFLEGAVQANDGNEFEFEFEFDIEAGQTAHQDNDLEHLNAEYLPLSKENTAEEAKITSTFIEAISSTIEKNKPKIIALLKEKTGEASISALRNDQHVETVAQYLYAFLPAVIRLALKEDVFIRFMLDNRDRILDHLLASGKNAEEALEEDDQEKAVLLPDFSTPVASPRKKLSSLKVSTSEDELFFVKVRSELQARRDKVEAQAPSELEGESAAQYYLVDLQLRVLQLALGVPADLRNARVVANSDELKSLSNDKVTLEALAYCIASISHLLVEEAEFDRAKLRDFLAPLEESFLLPYFKYQENGTARKSLKALVQSPSGSRSTEALAAFQRDAEELSGHIFRGDVDALSEAFVVKLIAVLDFQFLTDDGRQQLSIKLQDAHQAFAKLFSYLNEQLEGILVDYLEQTGVHQ